MIDWACEFFMWQTYHDRLREAGRQLVQQGYFDPGLSQTVGRALLPVEIFVATANQGVQQMFQALNKQ
jgi:hypothetical protein